MRMIKVSPDDAKIEEYTNILKVCFFYPLENYAAFLFFSMIPILYLTAWNKHIQV